jgi:hypothetical protein
MPGQVEIVGALLIELLQTEFRPDLVEHAPVQDVELDEGLAARAHFFHARLIERAPGIGKREPVELVAKRLQDAFGVARDPVPPIDAGAEHVIDERLDAVGLGARLCLRQNSRRSESRRPSKRAGSCYCRCTLEKPPTRHDCHRLLPRHVPPSTATDGTVVTKYGVRYQ